MIGLLCNCFCVYVCNINPLPLLNSETLVFQEALCSINPNTNISDKMSRVRVRVWDGEEGEGEKEIRRGEERERERGDRDEEMGCGKEVDH